MSEPKLTQVQDKNKTAQAQRAIEQQTEQPETAVSPYPAMQRAFADPSDITPNDAKILQRTFGNQAVQRFVVQRKMTVGPVGDKYEQEADAVAKQVMQTINTPKASPVQRQEEDDELQMKPFPSAIPLPTISILQRQQEEDDLQLKPSGLKPFQSNLPPFPFLQRQEEDDELQMKGGSMLEGGELSGNLESSVQSAKSGGQPLGGDVRGSMEQAFNADFSGVKVHTGGNADSLNRSISARAFTSGSDVFFRSGEYNPGSSSGKELLAHELTHTIQQGAAPQLAQRKIMPSVKNGRSPLFIQRELQDKSKRAFTEAEKENTNFSAGRTLVDGKTDVNNGTMQENVTSSEQSSINSLRKGFNKASPTKEKRLKDYIRAYLLWEFAKRTTQLTYTSLKSKDDSVTDKNAAGKYKKKRKFYLKKSLQEQEKIGALVGKGVAAPETRAFLNHHSLATGIPVTSKETKEAAGGPSIDVRATYIAGKRIRAHLFIIYTSEGGTQYYFRGGPDGGNPAMTVADWGEYTASTIDYDPSAPSVNILTGEDAKKKFDSLIEAASIIDGMKVPYIAQIGRKYSMEGENCNTAAWTMLDRAGIPKNKPAGIHPGWGHVLGAKTEGKEDAMPEQESTTGDKFPLPGDTDVTYEVYQDREKIEKSGDSVKGKDDVEFLIRSGEMLQIRYSTDKVGFISLSKYDEDSLRNAKNEADANTKVDKWYAGLDDEERFTYKVNRFLLDAIADQLGITKMDMLLRLSEIED